MSLHLAWDPDPTPGADRRTGALTVTGARSLPVTVEWGDGTTEEITEQATAGADPDGGTEQADDGTPAADEESP